MSSVKSLYDLSLNQIFGSFNKEEFKYLLQECPSKFIFEILFKVNIKTLFKMFCDIYLQFINIF